MGVSHALVMCSISSRATPCQNAAVRCTCVHRTIAVRVELALLGTSTLFYLVSKMYIVPCTTYSCIPALALPCIAVELRCIKNRVVQGTSYVLRATMYSYIVQVHGTRYEYDVLCTRYSHTRTSYKVHRTYVHTCT